MVVLLAPLHERLAGRWRGVLLAAVVLVEALVALAVHPNALVLRGG